MSERKGRKSPFDTAARVLGGVAALGLGTVENPGHTAEPQATETTQQAETTREDVQARLAVEFARYGVTRVHISDSDVTRGSLNKTISILLVFEDGATVTLLGNSSREFPSYDDEIIARRAIELYFHSKNPSEAMESEMTQRNLELASQYVVKEIERIKESSSYLELNGGRMLVSNDYRMDRADKGRLITLSQEGVKYAMTFTVSDDGSVTAVTGTFQDGRNKSEWTYQISQELEGVSAVAVGDLDNDGTNELRIYGQPVYSPVQGDVYRVLVSMVEIPIGSNGALHGTETTYSSEYF